MTFEELVDMMSTADVPAVQNWDELLRYYSQHLATLSGKLTQEEMSPLIAVGGMIWQRGLQDFKAGIDTDTLFKELQAKRDRKREREGR